MARRRSPAAVISARLARGVARLTERVETLEDEGVAGAPGPEGPEGPEGPQGPSGNVELGYAETTAAASTSTTLFANITDDTGDVAGLTTTVTVGSRPIEIEFWAQRVHNNTGTAATIIAIMEGNTIIGLARYDQHATASEGIPFTIKRRIAPSAGTHTYKIAMAVIGASTATIVASADGPAFISVTEK